MVRLLVVTRERGADRRYGLGKSLSPVLQELSARGIAWRYLTQEDLGVRGQAWTGKAHRVILRALGWMFSETDFTSLLWGILERLNMGRLSAKVARAEGWTHVHFHDPILALGYLLASVGRHSTIRWGVTEHGFGSYTQALHEDGARLGPRVMASLRVRERAILGKADWVVTPAAASQRQLVRDLCFPAIPPTWHVVPHTVPELRTLDKAAARQALGWADDELVVLSVGRLVPLKQFPLVIRAFAEAAGSKGRLVILGDGDSGPLQNLADELGVGARVQFLSTDDIGPYYCAADVYVSASETESFGLANFEAMAAGLASICTAVGGVPDVVADGAVLVPSGDLAALTGALRRLLSDPDERHRLGSRGRQRAAQWPSVAQVADAYLALYQGRDSRACLSVAGHTHDAAAAADEPVFSGLPALPIPGGIKVLVLAPHADDETLGCGGLIARLVAAGSTVSVAVLTDGAKGDPAGHLGAVDVAQVRADEARRAGERLGVSELRFLGFPDGGLMDDAGLAAALGELLQSAQPDWILSPPEADLHRDHRQLARCASRVWRQQRPQARYFEYEVWSPVAANCLVDVSAVFAQKLAAIQEYRLPLSYVDYLQAAEGLARYRALGLEGAKGHAEALRELS